MKKLLPQSLFIAAAFFLFSFHPVSAAYSITPLADTTSYTARYLATGVNNNNQVVGFNQPGNGADVPFLWQNGILTYLEVLPSSRTSQAMGINDNGEVVGFAYMDATWNWGVHAFFWKNHVVTDLDNPENAINCQAFDINDNEQIVGTCDNGHGELWQNGQPVDLGTLNGGTTIATAINNSGKIVGWSYDSSSNKPHAFLWQNGTMTDLGLPANATSCSASDINDSDQIVGICEYSNSQPKAFIWQNGQFTILDNLPGNFDLSEAHSINNNGQVVGRIYDSVDNVSHAFLWQNGVVTDLGAYPTTNRQDEDATAFAINDSGLIAGYSRFQYPTGRIFEMAVVWQQANSAPVVSNVTVNPSTFAVNTSASATGSFTDDAGDTHTAVWDWGDSSTSQGTVTEPNGSTPGSVAGSHTYTQAGVYTVTLTVTDNGGLNGTSTYQYVSVYNPTSQGLFSAGSHFISPAGAYPQNPNLTGDVKFGLSYKYQGAVPTGNKEFMMNFKDANLTFNATSITSLVISNGMATLRGTGTLNGTNNDNFLVTGVDGGGIRVKITDASNAVIYDTQLNAPDTATPSSTVTGHVVVHN